ncbi:MAG: hypothetical protein ACT4PT_01475 [Methanobacteriota archaeon]
MRAAGVVLGLLMAASVAAQTPDVVAVVVASDADLFAALQLFAGRFGFVDGNGNGAPDVAEPVETAYFDFDTSGTVSFGDLRLSPFFRYPAGSSVEYTNRDVGRPLVPSRGWIGRTVAGDWYVDIDASGGTSVGDVRLAGPTPGTMRPGEPDLGRPLVAEQNTIPDAQRLGWVGGPGTRRGVAAAVYADMNRDGLVSAGDLRFRPSGPGLDDEPTRAEADAATARLAALESEDAAIRTAFADADRTLGGRLDEAVRDETEANAALAARTEAVEGSLSTWTKALLALALVDLAGVAYLFWQGRKAA